MVHPSLQDCQYCRPALVDEPVLQLVGCRHPLAELAVSDDDTFVPNDFSIGALSCGPIAIISGANGSGKSVLLKQVGLIALMAHMGSFVPAKSATVGVVDRIFSRIKGTDT